MNVGNIYADLFTGHPVVVTAVESAGEQTYAEVEFVLTGEYGVRNSADLGRRL